MNVVRRLRFRFAAWQNDDAVLGLGSDPLDVLARDVAGGRVAIVGNARALATTSAGDEIDACDVVIRINRAPMPSAQSHGVRTDWLALATSFTPDHYAELEASRLIWMSHKRKRLRFWMSQIKMFTLFPKARFDDLKRRLGAQPTTGALLIDFLSTTDAAEIHLFGFDFFSSRSLSGKRDAASVPHDFPRESDFVEALIKRDPRITLHPME